MSARRLSSTRSTGRPVAIKPVIDVTTLAVMTAWGAMVMTLRKRLNAKKR